MMRSITTFAAAIGVACVLTLIHPSVARAEDLVTYEVVSDDIHSASIEYQGTANRSLIEDVPLPWRMDAVVSSARGAPPEGSQIRADWHTRAAPSKWVTVRIIYQGKVICQNTLDLGNATCYGITRRIT